MKKNLKPGIHDGLSQPERHLASLDTAYFKIDEKDSADLIKDSVECARRLNYYNFNNEIEGQWENFLLSDIDVVLALISKFDVKSYTGRYERLAAAVLYAENEAALTARLKELFLFIDDFIRLQKKYHAQFGMVTNHRLTREYAQVMDAFMADTEKLLLYNRQAQQLLGERVSIAVGTPLLLTIPESGSEAEDDPFAGEGTVRERVIDALPHFDKFVSALGLKYVSLLNTAAYYLKEQHRTGDTYNPHVGLFVAFLQLNRYVEQPLNQLVQKHLDYYYRQLIGMRQRQEVRDSVHLVLEPVPGGHALLLKKGEQLYAEIQGQGQPLLYELEDDVEVTAARLKELKTLFVSNRNQVKSRHKREESIKERQVYVVGYPVPDAGACAQKSDFSTWPLLGEDQEDLPAQQKTMQGADIGMMIASPLLCQTEGIRNFQLKIFIQNDSFASFADHVQRFSTASGISKDVVMLEMLNQSLIIDITGEKGWIPVEKFTVSCPTVKSDPFIAISFKLEKKDPPVTLYNSKVHGYDCGIRLPVVRLLLNNASFHHPYTFLPDLLVNRISIKADVKEARACRLRNTSGELYGAAPFSAFGALPLPGSYLDIHNARIFNRYTTGFRLRINWFGLPAGKTGFASYYEGYDSDIRNDSFRIRLSSNAAATPEEQQVFNLFETAGEDAGNGRLKATTEIGRIDFSKIRFSNSLPLTGDLMPGEMAFATGTVRLELGEPGAAFGHQAYPQLFTAWAAHNAKRFVTKRPAPNQPYTPVITSLDIDYTLEQVELIGGLYHEEEDICLIHIHPFGYRKVYPGKDRKGIGLAPRFEHSSNLFIGIGSLVPGQEIALYFQLEERNFHHTAHALDTISWSYLASNEWKGIGSSDILDDTTGNFVHSGVVKLHIPESINRNNTILNPDLHWISASLPGESLVRSRMISVFAQAAVASRMPGQKDFPQSTYRLPPNHIQGFKSKIPGLQHVWQLFSSFNGQPAESDEQYAVRVSERLRHKQRLLTTLDISQAVLNAFPQIMMVKCYCGAEEGGTIVPGTDIQVIVVPREGEDGGFTSSEPRVNLAGLYRIKEFLRASLPGFIHVEVGNPVYEKVMVVASVLFKSGPVRHTNGHYLKLLNEDINKHMAAWLYGLQADLRIGSKMYVSEIMSYIQNQPYIAYLTAFSLLHFYKVYDPVLETYHAKITDTSVGKRESLSGSIPGAILVPAEKHLLTVLDQPVSQEAGRAGIGKLYVGSGLFVDKQAAAVREHDAKHQEGQEDLFSLTIHTN